MYATKVALPMKFYLILVIATFAHLAFAQNFQLFAGDLKEVGWQLISYNSASGLFPEFEFGPDPYIANYATTYNVAGLDQENNIFYGSGGSSRIYRGDIVNQVSLPFWTFPKKRAFFMQYDDKNDRLIVAVVAGYGPKGIELLSVEGPRDHSPPNVTVIRTFSSLQDGTAPLNFGFDVANQLFYWVTDQLVNATFNYMHLHRVSLSDPYNEQQVKSCGDINTRSRIFFDPNNGQPFLFYWDDPVTFYGILRLGMDGKCKSVISSTKPLTWAGKDPSLTFDSTTRTVYSLWFSVDNSNFILAGFNIDTAALVYQQTLNLGLDTQPAAMLITND